MKRSVLNVAWLLLGVLAISSAAITLSRGSGATDPRIDSFGPSGLSAFAELLRSNGYRVRATASSVPVLAKDDVAVVCLNEVRASFLGADAEGIYLRLFEFANQGGHVVLLPFDPKFDSPSRPLSQVGVHSSTSGSDAQLFTRAPDYAGPDRFLGDQPVSATIWSSTQGPSLSVVSLSGVGKGLVLGIGDGFIATNRYVDKSQNADLLLNSIASVAPKGARLVFVEGVYAGAEPSLIELLGPGAAGAWYQSIFLFIVVVFTLGKRFGLPEESRPIQTGQRELVDAVADTYRRANSTKVACRAAYDRADFEVRRAVKLSGDAPASERDDRIPESLAVQFRRVFEGTIDQLSPQDAFLRCQSLRRHIKSFLNRP